MGEAGADFIVNSSLIWKGAAQSFKVIQSLCILQNQTAKRSKCLWNVQCILKVWASLWWACFFSVQSLLWKAGDFSLAFLSSSILNYRISQSRPYQICQPWLWRKQSEVHEGEECELLSDHASSFLFLSNSIIASLQSHFWVIALTF